MQIRSLTMALKPEMSPEIQNRGTSGPQIGHVHAHQNTLNLLTRNVPI